MAEPKTGATGAREAAGNFSRGIRHRLADFLRPAASRLARAGRGWWPVIGAGTAAGVLMIVSEFLLIRYVTTITASCSDLANPAVRDSCQTTGHSHHYWGIAILGVFTLLMTFGAGVGKSRPAAFALLAAGLVCVAIALIHDLPDTSSKGQVGSNFADARAHIGDGLWLELIGGILAVGAGALALTRLPEVAPEEGEVEEAEGEGAPPEEAEAGKSEPQPPGEEQPEETAAVEAAAGAATTRRTRIRWPLRRRRAPAGDGKREAEAVEPAEEPTAERAAPEVEAPEEDPRPAEGAPKPSQRRGRAKRPRERRPKPKAPEEPRTGVGADEGSEGEAVAQPAAESAPTEEVPTDLEGDSWDVVPDTPAARRSAERAARRRERAEAARRRQKRPPRERSSKKKPPENQ